MTTGDKQTIELDDATADRFKRFCQLETELLTAHQNWKELKAFAERLQYGSVTVTFKDSIPIRIDNPMQTIVFGLKI